MIDLEDLPRRLLLGKDAGHFAQFQEKLLALRLPWSVEGNGRMLSLRARSQQKNIGRSMLGTTRCSQTNSLTDLPFAKVQAHLASLTHPPHSFLEAVAVQLDCPVLVFLALQFQARLRMS